MAWVLLYQKHMLAHVYSATIFGIDALTVRVEADIQTRGLPGWNIVGLPETAIKESRERVISAIRNVGLSIPNRKITINLSPGNLKKTGTHFDLPIAIALLCAADSTGGHLASRHLIAGELSLTGQIVPVAGALSMAILAKKMNLDGIIIPVENAWEAKFVGIENIVAIKTLQEAVEFIRNKTLPNNNTETPSETVEDNEIDLSDVRGQPFAKRGLEIAAAGGHNIALSGPPGTGKTMLAERLPTIMPPLELNEALEVMKIRSWHGLLKPTLGIPKQRPFRAPHHSASYAGLIGGGVGGKPQMGEISLAHCGVLFLDEMAEFKREVLEVLRQPLESGTVRIVRSGINITYPARFLLASAFNPCFCGNLGHPKLPCTCSVPQIRRYRSKLSGPLMDRIDLHIQVGPPPHEALIEKGNEEPSSEILSRVVTARELQKTRYKKPGKCNAHLSGREVKMYCKLGQDEKRLIKFAADKHQLSARSLHRVLKVSKTIADLAGIEKISTEHIAEALQFRPGLDEIM